MPDVLARSAMAAEPVTRTLGALAPRSDDAGAPTRVAVCTDAVAWDEYVAAHPDGFGSHEWAWREIFARVFGHTCHYLAAGTDSGKIAAVLPIVAIRSRLFGRSMTALPSLYFGGVLAASDAVARQLLASAGELARSRGCRHD